MNDEERKKLDIETQKIAFDGVLIVFGHHVSRGRCAVMMREVSRGKAFNRGPVVANSIDEGVDLLIAHPWQADAIVVPRGGATAAKRRFPRARIFRDLWTNDTRYLDEKCEEALREQKISYHSARFAEEQRESREIFQRNFKAPELPTRAKIQHTEKADPYAYKARR